MGLTDRYFVCPMFYIGLITNVVFKSIFNIALTDNCFSLSFKDMEYCKSKLYATPNYFLNFNVFRSACERESLEKT